MSYPRALLPGLGAVSLLLGCMGAGEGPPGKDTTGASGPPLLTPDHADLSDMLAGYTGDPEGGAGTPGMIAAVVKGKHIVAIGAAGHANLATSAPMTRDMIFNIGSNTKNITATLLSILIEETPSLTWDTTLEQALPWATEPGKDYIRPEARKNVTLAQLVAHRSGIACSYKANGVTISNKKFNHPDYDVSGAWRSKTHEEVLQEFLRGPLIPSGGTATGFLADCSDTIGEYHYENGNFTVAQAVIDTWSGMAFVDYAREKLVDHYGLGETYLPSQAFFLAQSGSIEGTEAQKAYWNPYFFQPNHPYLEAGKYVWGHSSKGVPLSVNDPDEDPWAMSPASGGFAFNMCDWASYAILHLRETSAAWNAVHTQPFAGYNFGWSTAPRTTGGGVPFTSMCHTGALSGMRSKICVYPELDIAYLSMANGGPGAASANSSVLAWMAENPAYRRDTGGCKDDPALLKGVQRFWSPSLFGCAGNVAFADRASLCAAGFHVCSADEVIAENSYDGDSAEDPKQDFWTDDELGSGGNESGTAGTLCCKDGPW